MNSEFYLEGNLAEPIPVFYLYNLGALLRLEPLSLIIVPPTFIPLIIIPVYDIYKAIREPPGHMQCPPYDDEGNTGESDTVDV